MTDRVQPAIVGLGDDRHHVPVGERPHEIALDAVDLSDHRGLGQSRPDRRGQVGDGRAGVEGARRTVGKGDREAGHGG